MIDLKPKSLLLGFLIGGAAAGIGEANHLITCGHRRPSAQGSPCFLLMLEQLAHEGGSVQITHPVIGGDRTVHENHGAVRALEHLR